MKPQVTEMVVAVRVFWVEGSEREGRTRTRTRRS